MRFLVCGLTALAACLPLLAQAPANSAPTVQELVNQLGAESFKVRETASRLLLERGEEAQIALLSATNHPDIEVRTRANFLLGKITRLVDTRKQIAPKLVSVRHTGKALDFVLEDFRLKTGIPVKLDPPRPAELDRLVTVRVAELPPWEALEELLRQTGLREVFYEEMPPGSVTEKSQQVYNPYYGMVPQAPYTPPGKTPIWVTPGASHKLSGDRSTNVRIMALPATFSGHRIVRGSGQLQLCLDVTPLPGMNWDETMSIQLLRAEDETGRPVSISHQPISNGLQNFNNNHNEFAAFGGQVVFFGGGGYYYATPSAPVPLNSRVVSLVLRTEDRPIKRLKKLEGTITGHMHLTNQVLATIVDLQKAANPAVVNLSDDHSVSIVNYTVQLDGQVRLRVRQESQNQWQFWQQRQALGFGLNKSRTELLNRPENLKFNYYDADGKQLPPPNAGGGMSSDNGFRFTSEMEYVFPKKSGFGTPVRVEIVGTKPKILEVAFQLTDVVLP